MFVGGQRMRIWWAGGVCIQRHHSKRRAGVNDPANFMPSARLMDILRQEMGDIALMARHFFHQR